MGLDQLDQGHVPLERVADQPAHQGVGLAERHAPASPAARPGRRPPPPGRRPPPASGRGSTPRCRAARLRARAGPASTWSHRVEQRLLVLLEVPVVGQGQALQGDQQAGQVPDEPARPCPGPARPRRGSSSGAASSCRWRRRRRACRSRTPRSTTAPAPRRSARGAPRAAPGRRGASATKSRSDTASSEFSNRPAKPSSSATKSGSRGSEEPARAPAPSGRDVEALDGGHQPVDVAGQSPAVGQQMVGQQDRLGPLQVGVARQVGVTRLLGPAEQHLLEARGPRWPPPAASDGSTAAGRSPPGRCGSARCGAWPRRRRPAR